MLIYKTLTYWCGGQYFHIWLPKVNNLTSWLGIALKQLPGVLDVFKWVYSFNHRTTEAQNGPGWKGPQGSWISNPPPPPQAEPPTSIFNTRPSCPGPHPTWPWTPPGMDGASTTSLGSLFQNLTTLIVKNFPLISSLTLPFFNIKPFPLVLLLSTLSKSWFPSCL